MARRPLVLGHRGASARAPENTLEAVALARELGADGVEIDVRRTADGVLVVHHDAKREDCGMLRDRTFDELRALAPSVPTLDEVLDGLDGLLVNVELKCLPWEDDHDAEYGMLDPLLRALRGHDLVGSVVVSSFDLEAVNTMRGLAPKVPTGWLTAGKAPLESLRVASDLGHQWLHPDRAVMLGDVDPVAVVDLAAELGVRVTVWTVDEPDELRALAEAGVDAIITNEPDVARGVFAAMGLDDPEP